LFLERAFVVLSSLTNSGTRQAYIDLTSLPSTSIQ
jgi:hypothetical protein